MSEMNKRLRKCLDEEERVEKKISELKDHLKDVKAARKQEEDNAIVSSLRSKKLEGRELLELLDGIMSGDVEMIRKGDFFDEDARSTDAPGEMTGAGDDDDTYDFDAPESEAGYDGQTNE